MICLRCGWCCVVHAVILPDGEYKTSGKQCQYLEWDTEGKATCTVHGKSFVLDGHRHSWKQTPCGSHGQLEKGNTECRMGAFLQTQGQDGRDFIKGHPK